MADFLVSPFVFKHFPAKSGWFDKMKSEEPYHGSKSFNGAYPRSHCVKD